MVSACLSVYVPPCISGKIGFFPGNVDTAKKTFSSSRLLNNPLSTRKILNLPRSQALTRGPHGKQCEDSVLGQYVQYVYLCGISMCMYLSHLCGYRCYMVDVVEHAHISAL